MANANIFQTYLREPKSVLDYMGEQDQMDLRREQLAGARQQNALGALTLADQAEQRGYARQDRNALQQIAAGWNADTTPEQRIASLRNSGRPGLMAQADALEKAGIDAAKGKAAAGKDAADAAKTEWQVRVDKANKALSDIAALSSRDQALASLQHHLAAGDIDQAKFDNVVATIPQDPAQFPAWRKQMLVNILDAKTQLELQGQQATRDQQARNDLIGPDGKPNQAVLDAKRQIAAAGASSVSVNTGKAGLANELKMRDDFRSEPIYKAHSEVKSAYTQIQQGLRLKSPAGDLAAATKIMKLLDPGSVVRESELGMAMAATGLMDRVGSYAQNILQGTKLTETQRADFQRLADALYGESVKQYNQKQAEYKQFAGDWKLNGDRIVGQPAAPAAPAAVLKFDANGNPVQQ